MTKIQVGAILNEGKSKIVRQDSDPDLVAIEFKDAATAFNGVKKDTIKGKGALNAEISALIFKHLEALGIPTHFVDYKPDINTHVALKLDIIPVEVIVRNVAAGSFCKRYGRFTEEGHEFKEPLLELFLKDDDLNDPLMGDEAAIALGLTTQRNIDLMKTYALQINHALGELFAKAGFKLVDFKLEFGTTWHNPVQGARTSLDVTPVFLADEITPDGCRIWDAASGEKLDKDRFRFDLGDLMSGYNRIIEDIKKVL